MQECFDPVIDQILALVEQQVKDTADNSYPEIKACLPLTQDELPLI